MYIYIYKNTYIHLSLYIYIFIYILIDESNWGSIDNHISYLPFIVARIGVARGSPLAWPS